MPVGQSLNYSQLTEIAQSVLEGRGLPQTTVLTYIRIFKHYLAFNNAKETDEIQIISPEQKAILIEYFSKNKDVSETYTRHVRSILGFWNDIIVGAMKTASIIVNSHVDTSLIATAVINVAQKETGSNRAAAKHSEIVFTNRHNSFCPIRLFPEALRGSNAQHSRLRQQIRDCLPENFKTLDEESKISLINETIVLLGVNTYGISSSDESDSREAYRLPISEWPQSLIHEWEALKTYKTTSINLDKRRNKKWNSSKTISMNEDFLEGFMGYLVVRGEQHSADNKTLQRVNFSLSALAVRELVLGYIEFLKDREGCYNGSTVFVLKRSMALLHYKMGYITQSPELRGELLSSFVTPDKQWEELCSEAYEKYGDTLKQLESEFEIEKSRDTINKLMPIIETDCPIKYIFDMHERILIDIQKTSGLKKMRLYRSYTLSLLISIFFFRIKQWGEATYNSNNTGNLRLIDGVWHIYFAAKSFKNCDSSYFKIKKGQYKDYIRPIPKEFQTEIDYYIREVWPFFVKGESGPLFPNDKGQRYSGKMWNGEQVETRLSNVIYAITRKYISESGSGARIKGIKAFGPHAYRHLGAVSMYKLTRDFAAVARLLLDSIPTVREHYSFLNPSDEHRDVLESMVDQAVSYRSRDKV